ncbi:MAG: hypothetical protein HYZ42_02205, partial [Bacteroidetes bacterium]|nr:hypothetical protein [Bacteroidota bacterium]
SILKIVELNESLTKANPDAKPMGRFPFLNWISNNTFRFAYAQTYYTFNIETKVVTKLFSVPASAEDIELNDAAKRLSFN